MRAIVAVSSIATVYPNQSSPDPSFAISRDWVGGCADEDSKVTRRIVRRRMCECDTCVMKHHFSSLSCSHLGRGQRHEHYPVQGSAGQGSEEGAMCQVRDAVRKRQHTFGLSNSRDPSVRCAWTPRSRVWTDQQSALSSARE